MARPRFRYSPWDGTQVGFELDALDVMEQLTDDLLYHGDLNSALRRMMQQGFEDRNGERMQGLREMLEQLRDQRRDLLDRFDLGGVYEDIANELNEVVQAERDHLQQQVDTARDSGDQRRTELTEESAAGRNMELDMLPPDLAGKVKGLDQYDFSSPEAAERFEQLKDRLREQLVQQAVDQMSGAMQNMTPQDMSRMKDMLAELNQMLEQRARGEEPDFQGFMERHGDFFPEDPKDLDELLEIMAQRMQAMQALMNSMTPEQRAQLQELSDQLLEDMDLRWQMDQLGQNLRDAFPDMDWGASYQFRGDDPLDMAQASSVMGQLGDLDQLEQMLRGGSDPGALRDVDLDRVRQLLGDQAAASLERMSEITKMLTEAGLVEQREGRLELTPKGMRRLGQNALAQLFRKLDRDQLGRHEMERNGAGHERTYQTKPYEWGDPFNLHIEKTIRNAIVRGESAPVRLRPEDFEIEETETVVRSSTVLMLDLSLSMPMRDNFLPAKKVAMALHSLISMQYPRDYLGIVGFSEVARILTAEQLPEVSWDFVYGTNMQHGFQLARQLLGRQSGTKQIIMITDGEPTAHINSYGEPEFHYPPIRETVDATLLEVARCTREDIRINTFMLDPDRSLQRFVQKLTEMNRGRAFYTTPQNLGDYVLVDFIEQKRELLRGRR
ncbi:hypothetical protein [Dermatobacter hominis]|uniref:hypothetical protein n=1 Tax=Dermatobacter hominis TaxID=2884263 RepID=UPI001D123205|nr:hypothetical protein [Dermatobacter hominis]UDY37896.1 hypothetical protein LH044_10210 [Dermatobacter hominis]